VTDEDVIEATKAANAYDFIIKSEFSKELFVKSHKFL